VQSKDLVVDLIKTFGIFSDLAMLVLIKVSTFQIRMNVVLMLKFSYVFVYEEFHPMIDDDDDDEVRLAF
jgi:hypothetical protein